MAVCGRDTPLADAAPRGAPQKERPAIHVSIAEDVTNGCFQWIEIGAEEEGVPCELIPCGAGDAVALAYEAARSSRLGVGVGVTRGKLAIHETHMPAELPVITFDANGNLAGICRLVGANAGRLVKRMPLRFAEDEAPPSEPEPPKAPPPRVERAEPVQPNIPVQPDIKVLARAIARILEQRGIT